MNSLLTDKGGDEDDPVLGDIARKRSTSKPKLEIPSLPQAPQKSNGHEITHVETRIPVQNTIVEPSRIELYNAAENEMYSFVPNYSLDFRKLPSNIQDTLNNIHSNSQSEFLCRPSNGYVQAIEYVFNGKVSKELFLAYMYELRKLRRDKSEDAIIKKLATTMHGTSIAENHLRMRKFFLLVFEKADEPYMGQTDREGNIHKHAFLRTDKLSGSLDEVITSLEILYKKDIYPLHLAMTSFDSAVRNFYDSYRKILDRSKITGVVGMFGTEIPVRQKYVQETILNTIYNLLTQKDVNASHALSLSKISPVIEYCKQKHEPSCEEAIESYEKMAGEIKSELEKVQGELRDNPIYRNYNRVVRDFQNNRLNIG